MKNIVLIEAPSNLGLIEPTPGVEPGVKFLPDTLSKLDFTNAIGAKETIRVSPPPYTMNVDAASKVRNADAIVDYSKQLADVIKKSIDENKTSIVVGGDCSILIGVGLALKQKGRYGVFYMDGHTDYMWPEFSQTAGAAGMDLAIIAGQGHDKLTNIDGYKPYVKEEDVFCFGNREYDPEYVQLTLDSQLHYFDLASIREKGVDAITTEFLQMITAKKLDGFWIHLDVDILNDEIMPCVDSRTADGLWYDELKYTLLPLLASPLFTGMEITILDPTLDKEGKYAAAFVKEMATLFKSI
jgi:arginase